MLICLYENLEASKVKKTLYFFRTKTENTITHIKIYNF